MFQPVIFCIFLTISYIFARTGTNNTQNKSNDQTFSTDIFTLNAALHFRLSSAIHHLHSVSAPTFLHPQLRIRTFPLYETSNILPFVAPQSYHDPVDLLEVVRSSDYAGIQRSNERPDEAQEKCSGYCSAITAHEWIMSGLYKFFSSHT